MKPRRKGTIEEYQNGHWFLYITEWSETDENARKHTEIEIYYAKAEHIYSSQGDDGLGDPLWNTTDPNKLDQAMKVFMNSPEAFKDVRIPGDLPVDRTDISQVLVQEKGGPVEAVKDENGNPPKSLRMFPVHSYKQYRKEGWKDCPDMVPWDLLKPHEMQAVDNHSQDLERLAERGGLCPREMYAILNNKDWDDEMFKLSLTKAIKFVNQKVKEFMEERGLS